MHNCFGNKFDINPVLFKLLYMYCLFRFYFRIFKIVCLAPIIDVYEGEVIYHLINLMDK